MVWLCGVDGFKSEWCAVLRRLDTHEFIVRVLPFKGLLNLPGNPKIVAVDLPIGLPEVTLPGGRTCERLARERLGWHRARVGPFRFKRAWRRGDERVRHRRATCGRCGEVVGVVAR